MEWYCRKCNLTYHTSRWYLENVLTTNNGFYIIRKCLKGHILSVQPTLIASMPKDAQGNTMPKLNVSVEVYPDQVSVEGTYRITEVKGPQDTRQGRALILTVQDSTGKKLSLFVPFKETTSSRTNLYRLLKGIGDDTDKWLGKAVKVTLNEQGKRTIEPVK